MAASVRVTLSARATWAVTNDADVEENVRTTSMMVRKSRLEIVICCGGGAQVLAATPSVGVLLGAGGPEKTEGSRAGGTGAGVGGVGTEGAGARGSPICSTRRGYSLNRNIDSWLVLGWARGKK